MYLGRAKQEAINGVSESCIDTLVRKRNSVVHTQRESAIRQAKQLVVWMCKRWNTHNEGANEPCDGYFAG